MPTYEYRCPECRKKISVILSIKEHAAKKAKCPKCGGMKQKSEVLRIDGQEGYQFTLNG